MIQHGRGDRVIAHKQSADLHTKLRVSGASSELHSYNADHEFFGIRSPQVVLDPFRCFLDVQLKKLPLTCPTSEHS